MTQDPRCAPTLEEACKNPDGTYDAIRLLSWLSEALNPGKGIPVEEVRQMTVHAVAKETARQGVQQ